MRNWLINGNGRQRSFSPKEDLMELTKLLDATGSNISLSPRLIWTTKRSTPRRDFSICCRASVRICARKKKFLRCLSIIKKLDLPKPVQTDTYPLSLLTWTNEGGQELLKHLLPYIRKRQKATLAAHYLDVEHFVDWDDMHTAGKDSGYTGNVIIKKIGESEGVGDVGVVVKGNGRHAKVGDTLEIDEQRKIARTVESQAETIVILQKELAELKSKQDFAEKVDNEPSE